MIEFVEIGKGKLIILIKELFIFVYFIKKILDKEIYVYYLFMFLLLFINKDLLVLLFLFKVYYRFIGFI